MTPIQPEKWPQTNCLIEVGRMEKLELNTTSKTHREASEARAAALEEEDEDDDEDEEEEEEEEEAGDEEEAEEEAAEEPVDDAAVPNDQCESIPIEDRYFN